MSRTVRAWLAVGGSSLAATASAHSPFGGSFAFYDGLVHPLLVPAHALVLVAAGLLIAQQRIDRWLVPGIVVALACAAGLLGGPAFLDRSPPSALTLAAAAVLGLIVAARWRVGGTAAVLAGASAAGLVGLDSAFDAHLTRPRPGWQAGVGTAMFALLMYPGWLAVLTGSPGWFRIGTRVVAAWVCAIAVMVLALALAPARPAAG